MGFSEKFQNVLMNIAEKVDDNQYLTAIKDAFTTYMPFIIIGSFALLLNTLICSDKIGLAAVLPEAAKLSPAFTAINFATMSFMTIPIVILIAMNLAKRDSLSLTMAGVVAVSAYIAIVPQSISVLVGEEIATGAGLASGTLGAEGLFIGMIIAIVSEKLFAGLMRIDKIKIKMPASVPPAISLSFNTLVPILVTLVIISVFGQIFHIFSGVYINQWFYKILQAPMETIFNTAGGIVGLVIVSQLFWFLGIHGGLIMSPIRNPLMAAALAANMAAFTAGSSPDMPVTMGFYIAFVVVGGAGMILSLIIAIFLFSKREDHRMIAKLGLVPSLCGISEPVVFGLPLVLNPLFAIPFIFNSGIAAAIAMFVTKIGFLPINHVDVPFGVPIVLSAIYGHGWQGVAVQLVILAVTTIVWIPFVIASNKEVKKEEFQQVEN